MDFLAEPVVDFLEAELDASENDWKCLRCQHALVAHTRGLILHGACQMCLECPKALLTESAARKVKHGLLP